MWKIDLESGYSSPVLCDGRLYLTAQPANVICLEAASGKELWRQSVGYEVALGAAEAARIANAFAEATLDVRRRNFNTELDRIISSLEANAHLFYIGLDPTGGEATELLVRVRDFAEVR